ncbi:MAG TPA: DNA translocase FtsK [Bacillales bacterium]|nr:DNA translocase FtsK [Bacillales bacterium]
MTNSLWEKFLNLFTEEIVEEENSRPERRTGRIEEGHRGAQPRMLSHYPKAKHIRVPIIEDHKGEKPVRSRQQRKNRLPKAEETKQKRSVSPKRETRNGRGGRSESRREPSSDSHSDRRQVRRTSSGNPSTRPERPKFTGVDFHASDVPSPVHGFRKRTVSERRSREKPDLSVDSRSIGSSGKEEPSTESEDRIAHSRRSRAERRQAEAETFPEVAENRERDASSLEHLYFYGYSSGENDELLEGHSLEVDEGNVAHEQRARDYGLNENPNSVSHKTTAEESEETAETVMEQTWVAQEPEPSPDEPYITKSNEKERPDSVPYNVVMFKSDRDHSVSSRMEIGESRLPPIDLLSIPQQQTDEDDGWIAEQRERLAETLANFNVNAEVVGVTKGPAVTRFEVQPAPGVKVNKIKRLSDDLKLNLAAKDIRIEAPIPGKNSVGIEIPNRTSQPVSLREMMESRAFRESASPLTAALGLDITGTPIVTDLQKMPHGLIGGATGSGKSVCINSLLVSLLYKASPDELKLVLIDPKVVELAPFKDVPHLAAPVINDPKEAALALKWAVEEMERRYERFADAGARDIARYNKRAEKADRMPYIVIVIDELADLMMAAPQDVEESICRIAQKARACGIHLVLATQRPSVDVITGLIKANIPTRLAFSVSSQADSRTILDMGGAEKLLGHGDMLFVENGSPQSIRVQGNFVSDEEIDRVTAFVNRQGKPDYLFEKEELQQKKNETDVDDELFEDACLFVFEQGSASASSLQRKFRIGYNRASRLIEMMEGLGMISGAMGSKPRELLISEEEFMEIYTS